MISSRDSARKRQKQLKTSFVLASRTKRNLALLFTIVHVKTDLTLPVLRLSIPEGFSTSDEIFTAEAASTEEVYH